MGSKGSPASSSKKSNRRTQYKPLVGRTPKTFASFSSTLFVIWIPVVIASLTYFYLHPQLIIDVLDSWIGFSEHWEPASVSTKPSVVYMPAEPDRRDAVVAAFKHAWHAYERDAMGADEYHPLSQAGSNLTEAGGVGYNVIDSIDTMQIMGLKEEYTRAKSWVENKLTFERDGSISTFETTIRILGGLLSAYHLSGNDPLYLAKATELADRILPAFDSPSGLPYPKINLHQKRGVPDKDRPDLVSIAEVATLQLEFRYLSHLTGKKIYWEKVERIMETIKRSRLPHGLASVYLDIETGQYITSAIRLGSRGDSFYEYLLKQYIQTNMSEHVYREMYDDAMSGTHNHLIRKSSHSKMTYTSELLPQTLPDGEISWLLTPKQDHLACFFGGSLMLGATKTGAHVRSVSVPPQHGELSFTGMRDWQTGAELVKTCMHTHDTATGLSPEIVHFRIPSDGMENMSDVPQDWYIKGATPGAAPPYDARYMLRPETIESLFIAYRLTGDPLYRDHGWKIFQAIEKHCRVATGGYATILNVDELPVRQENKMETFFLSETLKYLYLLFSESLALPLDRYVFNTEAHPLPIFDPIIPTGFT